MKKETPINTPEVKRINGTQYIVLVDGSVARLLKPTVKGGKRFYNLYIKESVVQYSEEDVQKLILPNTK